MPIPFVADEAGLDRVPELLDRNRDEFCFSKTFSPHFIDALCRRGFLPMAWTEEGDSFLLIKLHFRRCILTLPLPVPVPKRVRKRAAGRLVTVDRAFGRCLEGIARQHPDNWIIPPLAEAFLTLHREPAWRTRFHSIELWEGEALVAGFHEKSGAGTVQLYATA